jgi:hypothetical protein
VLNDRETRTPIAYSVITARLEYFALDPRVQPDLDFLAGQDIGDWFLLSRTEDDRLWVIGTFSDMRPFVEYLFDRAAKSLRVLHHVYPELAGAPLVPMRPVTITSAARSSVNVATGGAGISSRHLSLLIRLTWLRIKLSSGHCRDVPAIKFEWRIESARPSWGMTLPP